MLWNPVSVSHELALAYAAKIVHKLLAYASWLPKSGCQLYELFFIGRTVYSICIQKQEKAIKNIFQGIPFFFFLQKLVLQPLQD